MRPYLFALTLVCVAALSPSSQAQSDTEIIDDGSPTWTAGGHYTAEINLAQNTLTLLPLDGADVVFEAATVSRPRGLDSGVYLVDASAHTMRLLSTHPEGMSAPEVEERELTRGVTSRIDAVGLKPEAVNALLAANVNAILIY